MNEVAHASKHALACMHCLLSSLHLLSPSSFEALQLLKSAYRNGHITAAVDAAKHLVDFSDPPGANSLRSYPSVEI